MRGILRRLAIAGGFTATAVTPLVAAVLYAPSTLPTHLGQCATGEDSDLYTGHCVPYLVPNSPAGNSTASGCPAGVSGAECTVQSQPISGGPNMPAPVPPQEPEQELAEVATPGY
jgi:hypothetical protein